MATELQDFTKGLVNLLIDPEKSKADIAFYMYERVNSSNAELSSLLGDSINEDLVEEVSLSNKNLTNNELEVIYKAQRTVDGFIELYDVEKQTKELKKSVIEMPSRYEARFIVDCYYQIQKMRIRLQNQMRAVMQGKDSSQPKTEEEKGKKKKKTKVLSQNTTFMGYMLRSMKTIEDSIKCALDEFSNSSYIGKWCKETIGVGPVIASCLMASFELKDNPEGTDTYIKAANLWSYAGLNNNNRPWLGRDRCKKIVENVIKENNGKLDDDAVMRIAAEVQWPYSMFEENARGKKGKWNKESVIKTASKIPYNADLKVLMYKIGESFLKAINKENSLYGNLLKQRKDYEIFHNEHKDYADQAAKKLENFNIVNADTRKTYESGKLPAGHIMSRCKRYVTKLFISHLYEAMYYNKYGRMAPKPYILSFDGHYDYIGPEVPYESFERDEEYVKIHPTEKNIHFPKAGNYVHPSTLEFIASNKDKKKKKDEEEDED